MQKLACVFSFKESSWVSCQKIVFNLHKSYQDCSDFQLDNFNFSEDMETLLELDTLAKNILQYDPDVIAIMDHKPHPLPFFQSLSPLYRDRKKPKILLHIFGDFTLHYNHWDKLARYLEGFEVEFLVASDRQKILMDRMLNETPSVVCPFPVDHNEFNFNSYLRNQQRQIWQLKDEDIVFLFTGRLSRQKRIKTLIMCFSKEFKDTPNAHLFLYGHPDNIGDPFLVKNEVEGEYFRIFYREYEKLSPQVKKRIHFMGAVSNSELQQVYQGADVLVNLSVHNDEDYGMSVAEAQFTGLPAVLTDWGGLASFHHPELEQATSFIPVTFGTFSKQISHKKVREALRFFWMNPQRDLRESIALSANNKFGLKRVTATIMERLSTKTPEFAGYSPFFKKVTSASLTSSTDPMYLNEKGMINNLFREIYSAYVKQN